MVILDTATLGKRHAGGLDKAAHGPGQAISSSRNLFFGQEDTMQHAIGVVFESCLGQLPNIHRACHCPGSEFRLQFIQTRFVCPVEDIGAVDTVCASVSEEVNFRD